jgi:hypothetical protein
MAAQTPARMAAGLGDRGSESAQVHAAIFAAGAPKPCRTAARPWRCDACHKVAAQPSATIRGSPPAGRLLREK